MRDAHSLLPPAPLADVQAITNETLLFRIEGWESLNDPDRATDTRPTIRINSSWYTAWH